MSTDSTSGVSSQSASSTYGGTDRMAQLGMDDFLGLMIAELQNQDPLDPMDNSKMLEQIGQIREIVSNDTLTETLSSVLLGQNLNTASNLVGKTVVGLGKDSDQDDATTWITGRVDSISVVDGTPVLNVDGNEIELDNISEILPDEGEEASSSE